MITANNVRDKQKRNFANIQSDKEVIDGKKLVEDCIERYIERQTDIDFIKNNITIEWERIFRDSKLAIGNSYSKRDAIKVLVEQELDLAGFNIDSDREKLVISWE